MTELTAESAKTAVDSFEGKIKAGGEQDFSPVMDEITAARKTGNDEWFKAFNAGLKDGQNDIAGLAGFELVDSDADGDAVFASKAGNVVQYDSKGNRKEIWGDPNKDCEFTANEDGTASHTVEKGDTVWAVAKRVAEEKAEAEGRTVNNQDVQKEMDRIIAHNQQKEKLADPNKIKPGDVIDIPADMRKEVEAARAKQEEQKKAKEEEQKKEEQQEPKQPDQPTDPKEPKEPEEPKENEQPDQPEQPEAPQPPQAESEAPQQAANETKAQYMVRMQKWLVESKTFDEIDKTHGNSDGKLDDDEIDDYLSAHKDDVFGDKRDYLRSLSENEDNVEEYSNDESGDEDDGISREDLAQFTEKQVMLEKATTYIANDERFEAIAQGDGVITREDVVAYIAKRDEKGPPISEEERKILNGIAYEARCSGAYRKEDRKFFYAASDGFTFDQDGSVK